MEYLTNKRMSNFLGSVQFDILLFVEKKFYLSVFTFCFKNREYNGPIPVKRTALHVEK